MRTDVRLFIKKLAIFLIPFALYSGAIVAIDPYNYFSLSSPVKDELKQEISFKLNYAMWKMFAYRRDPRPNILLGDSRMMALDTARVQEVSGDEYFNFAYGGGSLKEAVQTFEYAAERTDLENVYLGLDLNSYNGADTKDRVSEVLAAERNPLLYLTNNNTVLAAVRLVRAALTGRADRIGKPAGDKEDFWRHQLEVTARVYYANYRDPVEYRRRLADLSRTCRDRGINLVFVVFPSHMDLQDKIDQYRLRDMDRTFREELAQWGLVYDFAWENEVTRDRNRFKDPYHFDREFEDAIIRSVWGGVPGPVRVYGNPTAGTPAGPPRSQRDGQEARP